MKFVLALLVLLVGIALTLGMGCVIAAFKFQHGGTLFLLCALIILGAADYATRRITGAIE